MTVPNIPEDAREVYCNEAGEPIAFCPKDSIGLTDLARGQFFSQIEKRLRELQVRAVEKGKDFAVICIDVDDPTWTWLVDSLMPEHDWEAYRKRGERPAALGVVPRGLLVETIEKCYPAALPVPDGPFIAVFSYNGITAIA